MGIYKEKENINVNIVLCMKLRKYINTKFKKNEF